MPQLSFASSGPESAETILFLHGAGWPGITWHQQMKHFSESYRCIAADLPGHGASRGIGWQNLDATAKLVAELIESVTDKPVHLVGLSMGGDVGLRLLAQRPELVQTALLTGVLVVPVPSWMLKAQLALAGLTKNRVLWRASAKYLRLGPEQMAEYLATNQPLDPQQYRAIISEIFVGTKVDGLNNASCPVLIAAGEKEPRQARESAAVLAGLLPNAHAGLAAKSPHEWPMNRPELFNRTLGEWLRDQTMLPGTLLPA
ncbi:MAG: alpha/beta fold hydrolase [Actinomycetota bacterium]